MITSAGFHMVCEDKTFYYFERLSSVPHGSGNTKAVSDICVEIAKELNLKYIQDYYLVE